MNGIRWKWGKGKGENKAQADPFRRVACSSPLINQWEGHLPCTSTLRHRIWCQQLREGFKADPRATHEFVIGYSLANSATKIFLLFRGQYTLPKNSEAYQILDGLAWLLLDAKSPSEVRLEQNSLIFHQEFWPLAIEKLYEEIRRS